jgi:hypothetical protein
MLKTFVKHTRPHTIFDAENEEHRRAYFTYINSRSWDGCKFRFIVEEPYVDLPTNIDRKMISYYIAREFEKS